MLERKNRLRGKELFQRLFSHGKRVFLGNMIGFSLPAKNDTLVFGVTFKQKTFRTAALRHFYKRRTLVWLRSHLDVFPRGRAFVIHFQRPWESFSSAELHQHLSKFLEFVTKI